VRAGLGAHVGAGRFSREPIGDVEVGAEQGSIWASPGGDRMGTLGGAGQLCGMKRLRCAARAARYGGAVGTPTWI
jgi:hypothetical protein